MEISHRLVGRALVEVGIRFRSKFGVVGIRAERQMEFSDTLPNQTGGLEIGTEPLAGLLIGSIKRDEVNEVARRHDRVIVGLRRDALEVESEFVQRELPCIAVIRDEALQNAEGARRGASSRVFN